MLKYFNIPYQNNGRDFNGCDCYGLYKLIARLEDNKEIPDYQYEDSQDKENGKIYINELENGKWQRCEVKRGAMVLLRIDGVANHCGYMINDTQFIHILKGSGVSIASIKDIMFKNRIVAFGEYID